MKLRASGSVTTPRVRFVTGYRGVMLHKQRFAREHCDEAIMCHKRGGLLRAVIGRHSRTVGLQCGL